MKVRPGKNLIRGVLGLAFLSPLTFVWPVVAWLLLVAIIPLLILAILDYLTLVEVFAKIAFVRRLPTVVGRDSSFRSELDVSNQSPYRAVGTFRDVLPVEVVPDHLLLPIDLEPNGEVSSTAAKLRIPTRGQYTLGPVWLRLLGPRQFLEGQQSFDCCGTVKVLPENFASNDGLRQDQRAQLLMLDKMSRARQHGQGTEFESLSDYREGDDPRRIDWLATARLKHPIVRRFQIERHRDVVIVIDSGRLMGAQTGTGSKLDCAIDSGLMLAEVALKHGDRCGIGFFDDRVRGYHTPVSGVQSIRILADSIYNLQSRWRESDFGAMFAELQQRQSRRSLIVLISDIVDVETTSRFRASLARLASRHVVLFAALRTPLLERVTEMPATSLLDGARQAVSYRLLQLRQQALYSLRHSGVHVIDVEPSQLTVPLINEFIDLRCQNLL